MNSWETSKCFANAITAFYKEGDDDYNMKPAILVDSENRAVGRIKSGDSVIFCCTRGEREVQLTDSFVLPDFEYFERRSFHDLYFTIFTLYHHKYLSLDVPVVFKPKAVQVTIGSVISENGLTQLHIAESEKFAHVTFFFNGGSNASYPGEEDVKIESPKGVPFEKVPELSVFKIVSKLVEALEDHKYNFIVVNFANGDVIGHTHNFDAKIACAKKVDEALQSSVEKALKNGYTVVITADHGILETGFKEDGKINVAHTKVPVPFIIVDLFNKHVKLRAGRLANVASTILELMGLKVPDCFEQSLLVEKPSYTNKKLVLIILDGWGIGKEDHTNPIFVANPAFFNKLVREFPNTFLKASGEDVGLLPGKAGNSEAGHMNIGAGRVVPQDDVIVKNSFEDGSFFSNEVLIEAVRRLERTKGNLHLIGLLSERSSHGNVEYILKCLELAKKFGLREAFIHLILDGRSTEPFSAPTMILSLGEKLQQIGLGTICTIFGRGIALDRSQDYVGKTKLAYDALVFGVGRHVKCHEMGDRK
ncbi:MAG: alkaline phosphatase family protein [Pseudothermotoga sp.]|uniref:alkaline phosphatase family protein n=1 Tax=Pseudothermotoga sp. TaxID=2033661 RepID=UPI0019CA9B2E|nr:alkaline phosphatase family protein [Pseudothermotoga sp.]MBC7122918.1 alkaline phosphatase family protein [Pseudothermotoga sp.]MDI6863446.1 alkaline phosphatase family protein [Pseudothermotoga sp.]